LRVTTWLPLYVVVPYPPFNVALCPPVEPSVQVEPETPVVESKFITNIVDEGYEFQNPLMVSHVLASEADPKVCGVL
jgi:hypothetical protein